MPIFSLLKQKDFRIYIIANSVNEFAFMSRLTAIGWLSYEISDSPTFVGLVAAVSGLSMSILSIFGGVLADKYSKPKIMFASKLGESLFMLTIALLLETDNLNKSNLLILMFLNGIMAAPYIPSRMGFIKELIGGKSLLSGNAVDFGFMTLVGAFTPAIAGIIIENFSIQLSLYAAFVAYSIHNVLILLLRNKGTVYRTNNKLKIVNSIKFLLRLHIVQYLLFTMLAIALLVWNMETLSPVFAKDIFNLGPSGFGVLLSLGSFGAAVSSFTIAGFNNVNINKLLGISLVCAGIFIIIFSFVNNYMIGMILYSVIFAFGAASENALSTLLQNSVPDTMRGRAISLQALIWGFSGFSGLLGGYLSEIYGIQIVILISGIVLILISPIIKPISSNSQRMQIM
ncbi:MAG: MFS transporter [Dehalococcoidia bacterium]